MKLKATAKTLRAKTYKAKTEWIPINPCINCDSRKTRKSCWRCIDIVVYDREINAQRKLLQYMKSQHEAGFHYPSLLEYGTMLRQLDFLANIDKSISESNDNQLINRGSFAKYVEKTNE